jgi:hypothetical protein
MIALKRLPNWRARFEAACDAMKADPMSWGGNDCAVGLASRIVEAVTGVDCAAMYRGQYDSAESGLKLMRRAGFANLADMTASFLPEYPEGPCMAKIGDLVAIPTDTVFGFALGAVNGERVFVMTERGHGTVDLLTATRAFQVG